MKTLTVIQPWAYLICRGFKDVENRKWRTNYRGRVLIHASANNKLDYTALTPEQYNYCLPYLTQKSFDLDRSAIIGSVNIVDCVKDYPSIWSEKGVWNWVLDEPYLFREPAKNVSGKLSFWESDYEDDFCIDCGDHCRVLTKLSNLNCLCSSFCNFK